jgi:hypothetical protein
MSDRFLMQAHVFPGLLALTHFINGRGTSDPLVVRWPLPASILVQRLKENAGFWESYWANLRLGTSTNGESFGWLVHDDCGGFDDWGA